MEDFKGYSYDKRVEEMKKLWGDIKDSKTIFYGNKCFVQISYGEDKKYHFNFNFDQIPLEYFEEITPELNEEINKQVDEQIRKRVEEEYEKLAQQENEQKVKLEDLDDFMNSVAESKKNIL